MTLETLKSRIESAEKKIATKTNTITKKTALIAKKQSKLTGNKEIDWEYESDIEYLQDGIERLTKEIEQVAKSLESYKNQLSGVEERESIFLTKVPGCILQMVPQLVAEWDRYDLERQKRLCEAYDRLGFKSFFNNHSGADYEHMQKTKSQIHADNAKDAKALVIDLYCRVRDVTGEVTDWSSIHSTVGTHGIPVLNGVVQGKEGKARVESIEAGGYNIQKLHIRVLVHEF